MSAKPKTIRIESAEYVGEHKLHLFFTDGKEQVVNFGPFLENSLHPEIRKFLSPKNFKRFAVQGGELMWGDFDLIFPIMDLYKNKLDQGEATVGKPRFYSRAR
jgi:hypothetical protein